MTQHAPTPDQHRNVVDRNVRLGREIANILVGVDAGQALEVLVLLAVVIAERTGLDPAAALARVTSIAATMTLNDPPPGFAVGAPCATGTVTG